MVMAISKGYLEKEAPKTKTEPTQSPSYHKPL
jgi:hypothetical protein